MSQALQPRRAAHEGDTEGGGLGPGTVRNYLSEAIGKLGAANRIEAYRVARQNGWL